MKIDDVLLSICIPTYNRSAQIAVLVSQLLEIDGPFEVCVHDDGSTDGSSDALRRVTDDRLRITTAQNMGRASAMLSAFDLASGKFIMVFDDDDTLFPDGLRAILKDCALPLPEGVVGYIYHLENQNGKRIGGTFPVKRSNFLALRADLNIKGDKKEVVLTEELRRVAFHGRGRFRRIPTSLIWSRLARSLDVICHNIVVGRKVYLEGGMSANIASLKRSDAYPMMLVYTAHISGFVHYRYRSLIYFGKAITGLFYYGTLALFAKRRTNNRSSSG